MELTIIQELNLNMRAYRESSEVVELFLQMSDDLRITYEYHQNVLYVISYHDTRALDRPLEENIHDFSLIKH